MIMMVLRAKPGRLSSNSQQLCVLSRDVSLPKPYQMTSQQLALSLVQPRSDVDATCVQVAENMNHVLADSASQEEMAHFQMALEEKQFLLHRSL